MRRFAAEVAAVLEKAEPLLRLIVCDADNHQIHDFFGREGAMLLRGFEFKGGGGTDFRPAIAEAAEWKPDLLIYLTDCKAPYSRWQITQDRYYAANVLRRIGDKRAVPALIEALQDENINYQAAIVLGNLRDERAIPALLDALERARAEPRNPSRMTMDFELWAGYALLGLRHPTGLLTVVEFLGPEYGEVLRRHAVDALGQFGEKDAVPFLINALQDTDAEVRVNAIVALGRIGDKSAVPALKELLKNNDRAEGRARLRYEPPNPLFKLMTVHEASMQALKQIEKQ